MTSVPRNTCSYDTGNKPYKHDVGRGKWSSLQDFYCACMSNSYGVKYFSLLAIYIFQDGGISFFIAFIIGLFLFGIPIFFIQSFLGQFSSSGFISAFRITPVFKGLGYAILCLNTMSSCYYAIFAAFPLVYIAASLNPTLPWMTCENSWNTVNCTVIGNKLDNSTWLYEVAWSAVEYLHHAVYSFQNSEENKDGFRISWRIAICLLIVWLIVGAIIIQGIEMIGIIFRYFTIVICAGLGITFLRILFLPGAIGAVFQFFIPNSKVDIFVWFITPLATAVMFGPGWGTVLTMASYNNFNCNIEKYSIIFGLSQLGLVLLTGLTTLIVENYLEETHNFSVTIYISENLNYAYVMFPYAFGVLGFSNLWSIIFFSTLFLGEISGCVMQIFSILTAIFDEYEPLRIYKREFTVIFLTILMMISFIFTTNKTLVFVLHAFKASAILVTIICFIELMIVVWVYGRLRFQRDVKFMTNQMYASWKFYLIRFVTPIFILALFFLNLLEISYSHYIYSYDLMNTATILKGVPLLLIPIYFYWKLQSSTGSFIQRFKRLCRPNDWYPMDPTDCQNYNDIMSANSDVSNQLVNDVNLVNLDLENIENL